MIDCGDDGNNNSSLREKAHEEEFERMKREEFADSNGIASNSNARNGRDFVTPDSNGIGTMTELRQEILRDMTFLDGCSSVSTKNEARGNSDDYFFFNSALEWKPNVPLRVPMVYCDFTASHCPLNSIEDYIRQTCLPFYGNTHTNTSVTGGQSSAFVSEARQIIAEVCNAKITGKASQDVVLFAGNGTTAAVRLLIDCLGLKHFSDSNTERNGGNRRGRKPLIVLGPFEHHSNLLPWRELGGDKFVVETARLARDGSMVDMKDLERILISHRKNNPDCPFIIGSFSAASNVTGTVVDDIAITKLLHKHGALSFWDYATGASYLNVNINPTPSLYSDDKAADLAKDAVFFSGHKLLGGGGGTPGVLIVKKQLVSSLNPPGQACGGGTVFYVTKDRHRFLSDRIERYEGGTPNVVGIWRLGLVWRLKLSLKISAGKILSSEKKQNENGNGNGSAKNQQDLSSLLLEYDLMRARNIQERLLKISNLVLLDGKFSSSVAKLPIYSFLIRCGNRFLHYNYVCALLNDVFGIQSRGGCQCAGPYSQYLLGMNNTDKSNGDCTGGCGSNEAVENWLVHTKDELMRPGATRLSLPSMGTTPEQEDYVLEAIRWVATHGWKLLHVYRCNHRSGEWRHKSRQSSPLGTNDRRWLSHYRMKASAKEDADNNDGKTGTSSMEEGSLLANAMKNANKMLLLVIHDQSSISQTLKMVEEEESPSSLRWYVYPKDVARYIRDSLEEVPGTEDPSNIQGALRPLALDPNDIDTTELEEKIVDKEDLSSAVTTEKEKDNLHPAMLHFRDGEHSGEAALEEIIEGRDDGELSDYCQVFDPASDGWLTIDSYIEMYKYSCDDNEDGKVEIEDPICEEENAVESLTRAVSSIEIEPNEDFQFIPKNDQKKPKRDLSAWGKGQVQPLTTKVEGNENNGKDEAISRRKKSKHIKPPAKLMRLCTQAMIQWDMLEDGDRLLIGLSGGKDSMSLLHVLLEFQKKLPVRFEIEVCTIDPMTPSFDPSPLIPYVESLGLKYHYIRDDIVERAASAGKDGKLVSSLCAFCARMKRGNLYSCARKNNCNKLVLAQHLDDLAESFMMSVMHNGFLRTMKANYKINAGDLSVIRPLAYCRESLMTEFAKSANLPIINENCPACFEEPKERARMKKLLSKEETLYPSFYDNIRRAMLPLMHDDATAIMRSYTEEALAKSRKGVKKKPSDYRKKANKSRSVVEGESSITRKSGDNSTSESMSLEGASEEMLIRELARRRADKYRLAGAMPSHSPDGPEDLTGQVCTLNGGNGTIPCRELME
uniref:Aminotransferase class V domain-containing protein n=1 Tax=Pseudo-nitzschia australis TaxID=44445 RepID=A0A7S4ABA3_9STRA|mmetsp:Transcript_14215/g.28907  ORF Transcript_14215/g.28907 Transcript_14215/m.28907 type:complete len:1290 (-) Transcript_14215:1928-5797(-)|eukprot:CAMPEP_0168196154 /NCGR_PEP_ID=MMETSP0139_2-20121125/20331_1 /TAXON_ID=44445 /ORGANISM="Pseudo-nitzschia australis, Strain 10249 10 AB" /LENGTH=1289 /DNA_ID=CAMNT_0008120243 /DNA_START=107 /DNA_END=3976 /DNA_ORIENTATION=-